MLQLSNIMSISRPDRRAQVLPYTHGRDSARWAEHIARASVACVGLSVTYLYHYNSLKCSHFGQLHGVWGLWACIRAL